MAYVKMDVTKGEADIIMKIVNRAMNADATSKINGMTLYMDICATHVNGNPLDLQRLLDANEGDFNHDIFGTINNINRKTGKLENFFSPRHSL